MDNILEDFFILVKGFFLISLVWSTDVLMIELSSLAFISAPFKDFFIESKDIINWVVSVSVLYATYLKIKNEKNKK